ncbi:MAG TPA: hypothetical protein VF631_09175 [Allosphingosinicella sp.]|jgi:hypothetical protein|uniref:hypothetical protein n=1 Tax=Allosphingosinicella sp. TaxID=2823234 RepID=UPI002F2A5458
MPSIDKIEIKRVSALDQVPGPCAYLLVTKVSSGYVLTTALDLDGNSSSGPLPTAAIAEAEGIEAAKRHGIATLYIVSETY